MTATWEQFTSELEKRYNKLVAAAASNYFCTHCGWCAEACHVYLATRDPRSTPVAMAESVRRIYKRKHDLLSRILPFWTGAKPLNDGNLDKWAEAAFRDCTLCERCVVNCPMGVENPQLISAVRAALTSLGKAPETLVQLADMAITREENAGFFRELFMEHVDELEKDVQAHLGNPAACIPTENKGARILYVPLSGSHTIVPAAVFFSTVGESWTLSMFEASNFALFLSDFEKAKRIAARIINEARTLGVEEVVLAECGHAYLTMRWEAPRWFGGPLPFRVRSIVEVLDEYIRDGRLVFDPVRNGGPVTDHDSCNLGRKGGLFEEPRRVLRAVATDFREMVPNRVQSLCCGGGGGLITISEWSAKRLLAGRPKADQIARSGAGTVATSCENCRSQILELNQHYSLGVSVMSLGELALNALVTNAGGRNRPARS